jgi:WD40 repeat protein
MKRVDSASFITHVSIDRTGDFHAIMRSGQYGCVYDNFFESRRNISILDLETGRAIKNFRLNRGEGIKCFNAPHIVSKEGNIWRVWDVTSSSSDPKKIFELKISYLAKVAIEGNTLVAISGMDPFLSRNPSHITVVKDIERANETIEKFFDEFIDEKSGLLIHQNNMIYSTQLGSVKIASLVDMASFKIIHFREDMMAYLEKEVAEGRLTKDTFDAYRVDEVSSFVVDGNTLIGSTQQAIKVWNLVSGELQKRIPIEGEHTLLSLEGKFLSGFAFNSGFSTLTVRIWNVFTGRVVHSEELENKSATYFPSITLYNGTIYRIADEGDEHNDIDIRESLSEANGQIQSGEAPIAPAPRGWCPIL